MEKPNAQGDFHILDAKQLEKLLKLRAIENFKAQLEARRYMFKRRYL